MVTEIKVKHNWRDGVFRYLFKEKANFVQMYEVFTGKKLSPDEIEFRETDSILMSKDLKNDVAFLTKSGKFIALVEHQHTENPNMAIRMLIYYAELLKMYIKANKLNIFGTKPVEFPNAEFYVVYTGKKPWIASNEVDLGAISIKINFVNINYNKLEVDCTRNVLTGYSYLLKQFEYYRDVKLFDKTLAVDEAINDCRKNGYLTDYVYREEFLTMVLEHWTVEQQLEDYARWAHEAREEGLEKGREEERAKAEAEKLEIVKNMLAEKIPSETITKITGLTDDELTKIKLNL